MDAILTALAVAGFAAIAMRLVRAVFRLLRRATEAFAARETAGTRARRGDLTGMEEARTRAASARRALLRSGAAALGWTLLLAVPAFTARARLAYASYLAVWAVLRLMERRRDE